MALLESSVSMVSYAFGKINIRTGGTFFRLFPAKLTIKAMKQAYEKKHMPILYLHPYELLTDKEFWISWKDLRFMDLKPRLSFWLRQNQWSNLGHQTVERKLEKICKVFQHQGPMRELLA